MSKNPTEPTKKEFAVSVRNAHKQYGSKKARNYVLIDLNMTVYKGTIYGLLGASGCGKTTLLSCIVGRKKLNKGTVYVLGGKPGAPGSGIPGRRVGFMPQETALFEKFTIKETLMYYGWIAGMTSKQIIDKLDFYLDFLSLPSGKRAISNLSGGQRRRASLIVALMHEPELLILDEPTVGVDPVLRKSIWQHLLHLTKNGQITVGLMRHGSLLAEHSPASLLDQYGCKSLEDVFLKLCTQQSTMTVQHFTTPENNISTAVIMTETGDETKETTGITGKFLSSYQWSSFKSPRRLRALLHKDFSCWTSLSALLLIFFLPIVQIMIFCMCIGNDPKDLELGIVNHETNYTNQTYQYCPLITVCVPPLSVSKAREYIFSCLIINNLNNNTIKKIYYEDLEDAIEAIEDGDIWGVMYMGREFTRYLIGRVLVGQDVSDVIIEKGQIKVWLDMSNQQIGYVLQRDIVKAYNNFTKNTLEMCESNPKQADIPIRFEKPIYGSRTPKFLDFVSPGIILTIVFFLCVAQTATILVIERAEGLQERACIQGVTAAEILFSYIAAQFVVMSVQACIVLVIILIIFGVECHGDILLVIWLTLMQVLCGMCFGFVISACCEAERTAIQLTLGSFYPTLILSGIIWPLEGMPTVIRYIATYFPLTLATASLRSILSRGWSIDEPEVYYGFISTGVWAVTFFTIALVALKYRIGY